MRVRGIGDAEAAGSQTARRWIAFGVLWGLIALSNSSLLPFLPVCGVWMLWGLRRIPGQLAPAMRNAVLSAVCLAAVISPWTVRNWRVLHAFVPLRSNLGAELYESTLESNNGFPWGTTLPLAEADPEFQRFKRIGEIEFNKEQGARAVDAIRANRARFVKYTLRRIYFFWIGVPHTDNGAFVEAARTLDYSFLSFSGLFGLALALRRHVPGAWLFFWAFAIVPLTYYVITVQARFRHPLEPLICVLGVYLFRSADRTRVWSWQKSASRAR
jgi:hypothetical protein